jgi:flagellar biosynthesis protein FlhG
VATLDAIVQTLPSYHGLKFIAGSGNTLHTANLSYQEKQRLYRNLETIEADVLLYDVGAGTNYHALDFFMHSDLQICVTLPDPTSILDMYSFLQLATIRKVLGSFLSQGELGILLKNRNFSSLSEIFILAEEIQPGARELAQNALRFFHPLLIINRNGGGGKVNKIKLRQMINKYLSIDIPELGEIPEDDKVDEALKAFLPVGELYPQTPAAQALQHIAGKIDKLIDLFAKQQGT